MSRVDWTSRAELDLEEIAYHIGIRDQQPQAARRLIDRVIEKANAYARQPEMGTLREDLASNVRCFTESSFVVFYRPIDNGIQILLVVHGARDIPAVFRDFFA